MPLNFTGMYKLIDATLNYIRVPQIAMAPRHVDIEVPELGGVHEAWQYLVPNDVNLGHTIVGQVVTDEDDFFEIQDLIREGDDGEPVVWRFEPLTFEVWTQMGKDGYVSGWDVLKDAITDDDSLSNFYYHEWLLSRLEWWHETLDEPVGSATEAAAAEPEGTTAPSVE